MSPLEPDFSPPPRRSTPASRRPTCSKRDVDELSRRVGRYAALMDRLDIHDLPGLVKYAIRSGLIRADA